jgi:starch phosphorylase
VRVELYVDGVKGDAPVLQEMKRSDESEGAPGGHVYTAAVSAVRPAEEYTARAIPHFEGVDLPLEEARILWQR